MAFKGQFTYGIPVTSINIVDTLPDNAVIPASVVDSIKGDVLGISLADLSSQVGFKHYIGEEYGGGVVFHLYKDANGEEHGLIVSLVNLSVNEVLSNIDTTAASTTSYWNGQINTNAYKAQPGATSGAWKLCDDYSYDGFSDWYLPSIAEFTQLQKNGYDVERVLSNIPASDSLTTASYYWTSTEATSDTAYVFYFYFGTSSATYKSFTQAVRAIRQF